MDHHPVGRQQAGGYERKRNWSLWLLLIPFVALLYPSWYNTVSPRLGGVPFFLWYQFVWIIGSAVITGIVYAIRRGDED
jgi:hypothetical protein